MIQSRWVVGQKRSFMILAFLTKSLVRDQDDEFLSLSTEKNGWKIFLNQEIHSEYFVRVNQTALEAILQYGF